MWGSSTFQRVGGRVAGLSSGVEGGVNAMVTGGGEISKMTGGGKRFLPGENDK